MAIKQKTGYCIDADHSGTLEVPLIAGRCQFCYWRYRSSLKTVKPESGQRNVGIARKSDRQIDREIEYAKARKKWLPEHQVCEAALPGCKKVANQVHHMGGRSGDLLLDCSKWKAVCTPCHNWITEHSAEAIKLGLSLRRNT